jgi:hypothetical protein
VFIRYSFLSAISQLDNLYTGQRDSLSRNFSMSL